LLYIEFESSKGFSKTIFNSNKHVYFLNDTEEIEVKKIRQVSNCGVSIGHTMCEDSCSPSTLNLIKYLQVL